MRKQESQWIMMRESAGADSPAAKPTTRMNRQCRQQKSRTEGHCTFEMPWILPVSTSKQDSHQNLPQPSQYRSRRQSWHLSWEFSIPGGGEEATLNELVRGGG